MNSVNEYYIEKFNSRSKIKNTSWFKNWKNSYSVKVARDFLSVNGNGRISDRKVLWKHPVSWGLHFDSIEVKDEISVHMKPKPHADIAFATLNLGLVVDKSVQSMLKNVSKISSSISSTNDSFTVGCDFPGAILVSTNLVLRYLFGLDSLHEVIEKYPVLIMAVMSKSEGETIAEALSDELVAMGEMNGEKYNPKRGSVVVPSPTRSYYTFSKNWFDNNQNNRLNGNRNKNLNGNLNDNEFNRNQNNFLDNQLNEKKRKVEDFFD